MKTKLIFLHGGPGYPDYLEQFFANQFSDGIETVFYTQVQKATTTIDDLIEQLAEKVNGDRVFLLGHSWGGALAVEYFRRTNDPLVKGIILVGAYLHVNDLTLEYHKELARLKMKEPTTEEIFLAKEEYAEAGDLISYLNQNFNKANFKKISQEFLEKFDALLFVKRCKLPILNVFGEKDVRIPTRCIRKYETLGPHVKNVEIRKSAHFPFILEHDRKQVVEAVENFIRETL